MKSNRELQHGHAGEMCMDEVCAASGADFSPEHTPTPWHIDGHIVLDEAGNEIAKTFRSIDGFTRDAAFIAVAANTHDPLVSQLRQHHEDAFDDEHFERVAAGDMGCTTCTLIAKAEGKS